MRNRVHLLRSQLQKEKDSIKKHKSLTEDMVRKKVEISKIAALVGLGLIRETETWWEPTNKSHSYENGTIPYVRSTANKWTIYSRQSTWLSWTRPDRWRAYPNRTSPSSRSGNSPSRPGTENDVGTWLFSQRTPSKGTFNTGSTNWTQYTLPTSTTNWTSSMKLNNKKDNCRSISKNKFNY